MELEMRGFTGCGKTCSGDFTSPPPDWFHCRCGDIKSPLHRPSGVFPHPANSQRGRYLMSAEKYFVEAQKVYDRIRNTQLGNIQKAAGFSANSIAGGGLVHLFGSGHSVIPVLDVFPRYGSYAGYHPIMDPRLMWFNVVGPGGARELLHLERTEGYIQHFLSNFQFEAIDTMVVYSRSEEHTSVLQSRQYL